MMSWAYELERRVEEFGDVVLERHRRWRGERIEVGAEGGRMSVFLAISPFHREDSSAATGRCRHTFSSALLSHHLPLISSGSPFKDRRASFKFSCSSRSWPEMKLAS